MAERAAMNVASRHGVTTGAPRLLHHSNNIVLHLAPAPIVAKVGLSTQPRESAASLARELEVASFLAALDAPSAHPTSLLPPGPHREERAVITFWDYRAHDPRREADGPSAGRSLAELHAALAGYDYPLPPFTAQIDHAANVLETHPLPALADGDRTFLTATHAHLSGALDAHRFEARPLHGEAHLRNLLVTDDGLCWIDFEAACLGAAEWDLAGLDEAAADHYPDVDRDLLALMSQLRSLCVSVWCWIAPDRAPELRTAAEYHLNRLRSELS